MAAWCWRDSAFNGFDVGLELVPRPGGRVWLTLRLGPLA